ncbi:hypothetical protein GALMADRAFT_232373 [Galerina marginata CBS 339.88]|uniref:Uncharacterized protein n=1 Tax=Galerina marginata (strain CBS 339.88) TaxID=685588 RepID=A0A067S7M1_GALM3|nr:hypothetical protein GALMADRAFT_232373 [Galerina marginata CBS 339.88]
MEPSSVLRSLGTYHLATHLEAWRYLEFSRWPSPDSSKPWLRLSSNFQLCTRQSFKASESHSVLHGSLSESASWILERGSFVSLAPQVTKPTSTIVLSA